MDASPNPDHAPASVSHMVAAIEEASVADAAASLLEPAAARLDQGTLGRVLRGEWLGHAAHPMLTDLPLGLFMSATMLDVVGGRGSAKAAKRLIGLGLLTVPAVAATGMVDWKQASSDPRVRRVGVIHGLGNALVGLLYFRSWRARGRGHRIRGMILAMMGGTLALFTGYLGGHMSFARRAGTGERGLDLDHPAKEAQADADWSGDTADAATIDLIEQAPIPR